MDYQPLNSQIREIRLLTILPSDSFSDSVEGKLEHVSLDKLPRYTALSYCWGDPTEISPVLLNGQTYDATINLYHALQHLREKGTMRLWIDAICVNQHDIDERNSQVQLMKHIYLNAQAVVAWVGLENESGSDAILIDELSSVDHSLQKHSQALTDRLATFLRREYWARVWIIQEVALANELSIHCGRLRIAWSKFRKETMAIMKRRDNSSAAALPWYQNLHGLIRFRRIIKEQEEIGSVPLLPALYDTWTTNATDQRDKIYGLLGITTDGSYYIPAPDYSKANTVEHVCRQLTLGVISWKRRLDIVPFLGRGCDDTSVISGGSPSWVPRWHALDGSKLKRQTDYLRDVLWAAGTSTSSVFQENNIISCEGMLVGIVHATTRSVLEDQPTKLESVPHPVEFQVFECKAPNPYGNDEDTALAIFITLCCLRTKSAQYDYCEYSIQVLLSEVWRIWRSSYLAGFDPKIQAWIDKYRSLSFYSRTLQGWASWMTNSMMGLKMRMSAARRRQKGLDQDVRRFIIPRLAYMIENGMRLMVTNKGYIGWAHPRAKVGDSLFIFKGCSVPVILRTRDNGGWLVVGDAYIQGMMEGELTKDATESSWEEVKIH